MSNTRHFYLVEYEKALQYALQGNREQCIDICLELRAQPDLALLTRAMVNITLCNLSRIEERPHKAEFAREALRIAQELRSLPDEQTSTWEKEQCESLETRARSFLAAAEREEAQYEESLTRINQAAQQAREEKGKGRQSSTEGIADDSAKVELLKDESEYIEIDIPRTDFRPIVPWETEGKFSVNVTNPGAQFSQPSGAKFEQEQDEHVGTGDRENSAVSQGISSPLFDPNGGKADDDSTFTRDLPIRQPSARSQNETSGGD